MVFTDFAPQAYLDKLVNNAQSLKQPVWENLCVKATKSSYHKSIPETSLSIITNSAGIAHCKVDGKYFKLCDSTFLIINPFQQLEYSIESKDQVVQTQNIHFNYQFALSSTLSIKNALDLSTQRLTAFPYFFNELHYKTPELKTLINRVVHSSNEDLELSFSDLVGYLHVLKNNTIDSIQALDCIKKATKIELFKRVSTVKDLIYTEYNTELSLDKLSHEAMLSKYHLVRVFKATYGQSPYEMLKNVRLEKAKDYLKKTDFPLQEVAELIGFKEGNSLSKAFKDRFGIAPGSYRISNIE